MAFTTSNVQLSTIILVVNLSLPIVAYSESILNRSPFLPPNWTPPANSAPPPASNTSPQSPSTLQFKGVYQIGGKFFFNIHDTRSKTSRWVPFDSADAEYHVTEYVPKENLIRLSNSNRDDFTLTMELSEHRPIPVTSANTGTQPTTRPAVQSDNRRRVIRPTSESRTSSRRRVIRR